MCTMFKSIKASGASIQWSLHKAATCLKQLASLVILGDLGCTMSVAHLTPKVMGLVLFSDILSRGVES